MCLNLLFERGPFAVAPTSGNVLTLTWPDRLAARPSSITHSAHVCASARCLLTALSRQRLVDEPQFRLFCL